MATSAEAAGNTAAGVDTLDWTEAFALQTKEAFFAAYAEDVVIEATLGPGPIRGREMVYAGMSTVFGNYDSIPQFTHQAVNGNRTYLEWEVTAFGDPEPFKGVTVLTRNAEGKISHIAIHHRPLFKILRLVATAMPGLTDEQRKGLLLEDTLTDQQRALLRSGEGLLRQPGPDSQAKASQN